jgi:hypothetical protein
MVRHFLLKSSQSPADPRIPPESPPYVNPQRECWSFRVKTANRHSHPHHPMKIPLFITVAALALFANSCRTVTPIDPMTMKPSERCLPDSSGQIYGTK